MNFRTAIKAVPGVRLVARKVRNWRTNAIDSSADYWEGRYKEGGNSGAGSYNRLATFKADYLNEFVRNEGIRTVIEFGSGDGAQVTLSNYESYVGVDVSETAVEVARNRCRHMPNVRFIHTTEYRPEMKADLVLSLDVIYHLVEDEVFERYMHSLFDASERFVIIYSSNRNDGFIAPHVRHRKFADWIQKNRPDACLIRHDPNRHPFNPADQENTSFADFYVYSIQR